MRLKDKIAIVTGGGSGFGEGIVRKFIAEGTRVVVADRDQAAAERVAGAFDGKAVAAVADISNESGFAAVVQKALRDFGGARYPRQQCRRRSHAATARNGDGRHVRQDRQRQHEVHLLRRRIIVPHFKQQKYGVVLNVASTGGVSPRPNLTWYNASKGWVITATRAWPWSRRRHPGQRHQSRRRRAPL